VPPSLQASTHPAVNLGAVLDARAIKMIRVWKAASRPRQKPKAEARLDLMRLSP
jgi:hypothetical protein